MRVGLRVDPPPRAELRRAALGHQDRRQGRAPLLGAVGERCGAQGGGARAGQGHAERSGTADQHGRSRRAGRGCLLKEAIRPIRTLIRLRFPNNKKTCTSSTNGKAKSTKPPSAPGHCSFAPRSVITCSDFFLLFRNLLKRPLFSSSFWVLSFPGTTFPGKNTKTQRLKNHHQSHKGRLVRQNTCMARRDRTDGSGGSSCRGAATVSFSAKRVSLQATYLRFQHFTPPPPTPPPPLL